MEVIGVGGPTGRRSGIPIRLPPKNICDVNPWVCRMTPANFSALQGKEPAVARMTFEPQPRGCNCCVERLAPPRLSDSDDDGERYKRKRSSTEKKRRFSSKRKSTSPKAEKAEQARRKKQKEEEYERVRLLREKKRRCNFVTACCQGLMMTPCGSVDSCSDLHEEKEQANFFIHADCAHKVSDSAKPCKQVTHEKKQRADFPCQCRTCKHVKHKIDSRTGCRGTITEEKTVCYCTDEEKIETDAELKQPECSPCKCSPVNDSPPRGDYQAPGPCRTKHPNNCIEDSGQPAGKVLFTAALAQEMLIQLARNGVDMANCIPTNNQYLVDCQRLPCAPAVAQPCPQPCNQTAPDSNNMVDCRQVAEISCPPDLRCRVYNCDESLRSPPFSKTPDCNTTPICNNTLECTKVGEINCQPDLQCHVYNCQQPQPQYNRVKCTTMPDCTTIYDLDCQPDVTYRLNNWEQPPSPMPNQPNVCNERVYQEPYSSNQPNVCNERVCQEPYSSNQPNVCNERVYQEPYSSSRFNRNPSAPIQRHRGNFQDNSIRYSSSGGTNPCGHICIPKGAVPGCAGDMSRSKFLIPLTFHPRMESFNSGSYPCMDSSKRRPPAPQERMSSIQENLKMYSSSRKISEPKVKPGRLSDERTSDLRNIMRSNETQATKRSSPIVSPRNSSGYYATSAIDQPPISLPKPPEYEIKAKKERKIQNQKADNKIKTVRHDVRRRPKQSEPTKNKKERPRSRSPSPVRTTKSTVSSNTKELIKQMSSKTKSSHRPASPPHFEDVEPNRKAVPSARNDYEAELVEAMDKVRRRYLEQNYDTTGSSSARSRTTTATEPCVTPTYKEFMCLTEQIKCLRKELRKYCSAEC